MSSLHQGTSGSSSSSSSSSSMAASDLKRFEKAMVDRETNIKSEDSKSWMQEMNMFTSFMDNIYSTWRLGDYTPMQLAHFFGKLPGITKEVMTKKCSNDEAIQSVEAFLCGLAKLCYSFLLHQEPIEGVTATLTVLLNPSTNFYQKYGFTTATPNGNSNGSSSSGGQSALQKARIMWLKSLPAGGYLNLISNNGETEIAEITETDGVNIFVTNYTTNKTDKYHIENDIEKFRPMDDSESSFSAASTDNSSSAAGGGASSSSDKDYSKYLNEQQDVTNADWRYGLLVGDRIDAQNLDDLWYMALILESRMISTSSDGKCLDLSSMDSTSDLVEGSIVSTFFRIAFIGLPESSDLWIHSNSSVLAPFMTMSKGRRGENPVREEVNFMIRPIKEASGTSGDSSPSESILQHPNGFFSKSLMKVVEIFYCNFSNGFEDELFNFLQNPDLGSSQHLNFVLSVVNVIGLTAPLVLNIRNLSGWKKLMIFLVKKLFSLTEQEVRAVDKETLDSAFKGLEAIILRVFDYERGEKLGKLIETTQKAMAEHYLKCENIIKKSHGLQMYIDMLKKGANCTLFPTGIHVTVQQSNNNSNAVAIQALSLGLEAKSYRVVHVLHFYNYRALAKEIADGEALSKIITDGSITQLQNKIVEALNHLIFTDTINEKILDSLWHALVFNHFTEAATVLTTIIAILPSRLIYRMLELIMANLFYSPLLFPVCFRLRDMYLKEHIEYANDENMFIVPSSALSEEQSHIIESNARCFESVIQLASTLPEAQLDSFFNNFDELFSFGARPVFSDAACKNHIFRCQALITKAVESLHENKNNLTAIYILTSYVKSWSVFDKVAGLEVSDMYKTFYVVDELNAKYELVNLSFSMLLKTKSDFSACVSQYLEFYRNTKNSDMDETFIFDASFQSDLKEQPFYQVYIKNFTKITKFITMLVQTGSRITIERSQVLQIWNQIVLQAITKNEVNECLAIFVLQTQKFDPLGTASATSSASPRISSPFLSLEDLNLVLSLACDESTRFFSSHVFQVQTLIRFQNLFQLVNNCSKHSRIEYDEKGNEKWSIVSHPVHLIHWDIFLKIALQSREDGTDSVAKVAISYVASLCNFIPNCADNLDNIYWLRQRLIDFTMNELKKMNEEGEVNEVKFRRLILILDSVLKEASYDSRTSIRSHFFTTHSSYVNFSFSYKSEKYSFSILKSASIGDLFEKVAAEIKLKPTDFRIVLKAQTYLFLERRKELLSKVNNLTERENLHVAVMPDIKKENSTVSSDSSPKIEVDYSSISVAPEKLPANIIAQNGEYMDVLFSLLENNTNSGNLWSLICKLPTIHSVYFSWLKLTPSPVDSGETSPSTPGSAAAYRDASVLLKSFCIPSISLSSNDQLSKRIKLTHSFNGSGDISLLKLLYNLQIIEYLIEPVKKKEQWQSLRQLFNEQELPLLESWPSRFMQCNGFACILWAFKQSCALLEVNVRQSCENCSVVKSNIESTKFVDKKLLSCILLSSKILSGMCCHYAKLHPSLPDVTSSLIFSLINPDSGASHIVAPPPPSLPPPSIAASAAGGGAGVGTTDVSTTAATVHTSTSMDVDNLRNNTIFDDIFGWAFTRDDLRDEKFKSDDQDLCHVAFKTVSLLRLFSRFSPIFIGADKNTVNLLANQPYNNLMNSINSLFMIAGIMTTLHPVLLQKSCEEGDGRNCDISMLVRIGCIGFTLAGSSTESQSTQPLSALEKDMSALISESLTTLLRVIDRSNQCEFAPALDVLRSNIMSTSLETIDSLLFNRDQSLTFSSLTNIFEILCSKSMLDNDLVFPSEFTNLERTPSVFSQRFQDRRAAVAIQLFENILTVIESLKSNNNASAPNVNWNHVGLCTRFLTIFAVRDKTIFTTLISMGYDVQKIIIEDFLGLEKLGTLSVGSKCLVDTFALADANIIRSNLYELLLDRAKSDINLAMKLFFCLHDVHKTAIINKDVSIFDPADEIRSKAGYVGLRNFGCTCYMNSLLQVLFSIPGVQGNILSLSYSSSELSRRPEIDVRNDYILQFQKLFMNLKYSVKKDYLCEDWIFCFKDEFGVEPVQKNVQQDAQEFLGRLCQRMEDSIMERNNRVQSSFTSAGGGRFDSQILWDRNLFASPFEGKLCDQIFRAENDSSLEITAGMEKLRENPQPYTSISINVRGAANIEESLRSSIKGESINNFDFNGQKITVIKRTCISKLSDNVIIHLKRFEMNYETFESYKVNDKFAFPLEIDMFPYTTDGLDLSSANRGGIDRSEYMYELHAIVMHQGTLHSGHYYSYIKCPVINDNILNSGPGKSEWLEFNDSRVCPFDIKTLETECFGSNDTTSENSQKGAYMLVYKKKTKSNISRSPMDSDENSPPPLTPFVQSKQDDYVLVEKPSSLGSDSSMVDVNDIIIKSSETSSSSDMQLSEGSGVASLASNSLEIPSADSFQDQYYRAIAKENLIQLLNSRIFCFPHISFFRQLSRNIFKHVDNQVFVYQQLVFPWTGQKRDAQTAEDLYSDFVVSFITDSFRLFSKSCHGGEVSKVYSLIRSILERFNFDADRDEDILLKRGQLMSLGLSGEESKSVSSEDISLLIAAMKPSTHNPTKRIMAFLMANYEDIFIKNIYSQDKSARESFSDVVIALFLSLYALDNPNQEQTKKNSSTWKVYGRTNYEGYDDDVIGPHEVRASATNNNMVDEDAELKLALELSLASNSDSSSASGGSGEVSNSSSSADVLESKYLSDSCLSESFVKMITSNTCLQLIPSNWRNSTAFTKLLAALVDCSVNNLGCLVVALAYVKRKLVGQIVDIILGDKSPFCHNSNIYDSKTRKRAISSFETIYKTGPKDEDMYSRYKMLPDWTNLLKTLRDILCVVENVAYDNTKSQLFDAMFENRNPLVYCLRIEPAHVDCIVNRVFLSTLLKQCRYNEYSSRIIAYIAVHSHANNTLVNDTIFDSLQQQQVESLINVFYTLDYLLTCNDGNAFARFNYLIPPAKIGGGGGILAELLHGYRDQPAKAKYLTVSLISILSIWQKLCKSPQCGSQIRNALKTHASTWAPWIIKFIFQYEAKLEREKETDIQNFVEILGLDDLRVANWSARVGRLREMVNEILITINETFDRFIGSAFDGPNPFLDAPAASAATNYDAQDMVDFAFDETSYYV